MAQTAAALAIANAGLVVGTIGSASSPTVQSRNAPIPTASSTVQLNDTAPINDRWNFTSVEIVP
jgi:hypothetical protein